MDSQISKIREEIAAAERKLREERIKGLEERHKQAVIDTRLAREVVQKKINEFREQSFLVARAEEAYIAAQTALVNLDKNRDEYPSQEEATQYAGDYEQLVADMEVKRKAYIEVKNAREVLRLEGVKADAVYVSQAQVAQNLKNELVRAREEDATASSVEKLSKAYGGSVQIAR